MMWYYLLFIEGDIEPDLIGPFSTGLARDEHALWLRKTEGEGHGYFRVSLSQEGPEIDVETFSGDFFKYEDEEA